MNIKIRKADFKTFEQLLFSAEFDEYLKIGVRFYENDESFDYESILIDGKWLIKTV